MKTSAQNYLHYSNEELCILAQQQDVVSRDYLYQRCRPLIKGLVYREKKRLHLHYEDLPDVVADLFFVFERAVQKYCPVHNEDGKQACFTTFLTMLVLQDLSKYSHKRMLEYTAERIDIEDISLEGEELGDIVTEPVPYTNNESAPDLHTLIFWNIESDSLAEALHRLPREEQHILYLSATSGCDCDIAEQLHISSNAFKQRKKRAIHHLRTIFDAIAKEA